MYRKTPSLLSAAILCMLLSIGLAFPLDTRAPGCDAECQHNRNNHPKPHKPGTISFHDWSPPTQTCSNGVCSSTSGTEPLIALTGFGFGPNRYAQFTVWWRDSNQQLWSALAPIDNLGYTGIETPLRDCKSYADAPKDNAYAKAYDSVADKWSEAIFLSTGCNDKVL